MSTLLTRGACRVVSFVFANDRHVFLDVTHPGFYVFYQVRKVEKCVLLLTYVDECRLNARHDSSDATNEDVSDGAFVFLVLNKQLREIAILNDGNAGLLSLVDNNFLRHIRLSFGNGSFREFPARKEDTNSTNEPDAVKSPGFINRASE